MVQPMSAYDSPEMLRVLDECKKGNYSVAFALVLPLAEGGNPKAQCWLASFYQLGLGTATDGRKAAELYKKVAERNISEEMLSAVAYNNLSSIYFGGLPGVNRDTDEGEKYRELARQLGFPM